MKSFMTINGRRIEVVRKGSNGRPILILTGMACSFEEWFEVTEALSETNKVIMFHRPGLGASEIGEEQRTTAAVVQEMEQLLSILEVAEPVILAGHSYGGLCAQHFTKLHPEKVKALLLVDSTSVDLERLDELELPGLQGSVSDEEWLAQCAEYAQLSENELRNIIQPVLSENQQKLPSVVQKRLIEFQQQPNLYKAMKSEVENWKSDAKTIKNLASLRNTPLTVIGRDKHHMIQQGLGEGLPESELMELENMWQRLILEQGELSPNSTVQLAKQAGHSVHLDRPDLVVSALKELAED